jgi:hypothetical protein
MRQAHAAGDKLFVDYAGDGVPKNAGRGEARSDRQMHDASHVPSWHGIARPIFKALC